MAHFITHRVAKGMENNISNNLMTFWKTNFNMPVPYLFDGWTEGGPFIWYGQATSFDLTGFLPGWEIAVFFSLWHWNGPAVGTAVLYSSWRDTDSSLMSQCANTFFLWVNLPSGYWQEYCWACNIGVAGWEIDVAGNYGVRSSAGGDAPVQIAQKDTSITFSNVPSTAQLDADKAGYVWVEGNDLCYICASRWKHSISGDNQGAAGAGKAGYIWIDDSDYLHWIGNDNNDYRVPWKIQQFASSFSNGPTSEVCGEDEGYFWTDSEFGWTHLSYIGHNTCKFLIGSGKYPYVAP